MIASEGAVSDRLHQAGFSVAEWRAGGDTRARHRVAASGPLGRIRVEAASRPEAFALALAEARKLVDSI